MRRILVTGMSGTGKSSALAALAAQGFRVVDTDEPGWKEARDGDELWREDRIAALLAEETPQSLFVSGAVPNQGRFYDRFDAVVLLSAPPHVLVERIATRTTNDFGKDRRRARQDPGRPRRVRTAAAGECDPRARRDAAARRRRRRAGRARPLGSPRWRRGKPPATSGQLRVEATGEPFAVSLCHCLACQRRTGSAFGMQAGFKAGQVRIAGRYSDFSRISDEAESGYDSRRHEWLTLPDSLQSPSELWEAARPLYEAGRYAEAAAKGLELIELRPGQPSLHFNVACCFSRAGRPAEDVEHLGVSIGMWEGCREMAQQDSDFDPIRDDPAFAALVGAPD